jgi:hypothetical protein
MTQTLGRTFHSMMFLTIAILLTFCAIPLVRTGSVTTGRITASGFDGSSVLIGFICTVAISALTSPLIGLCFVFAVLLHEFCAARACQIIGHDVARVRLLPLPFLSPPRSDRPFESAVEESFAALYAPALSIVPMVLFFALFHISAPHFPSFANVMWLLGIVTGTFNFIMLLPFLPFAGGRVVRAVSESFWPRLSTLVTVFMTAAFASAAVTDQSIAFMILTAAGVQSLVYRPRAKQTRLSPNETLLVLATYSFCLTAHFTGGWWLLTGLL